MSDEVRPARIDELLAHAGWVRALARRLARDGHTAEDLEQETWAVALRRPPRRAGGSVQAWLAAVVARLARHQRRSEARRAVREAVWVQGRDVEREGAQHDAPKDALEHELASQRELGEVVLGLPEPYRTVLLRRYYRRESAARIARRLERPAGTVRSQLARGLALARRELDRRHGGDSRSALEALVLVAGIPSRASLVTATSVIQGVWAVKESTRVLWLAGALVIVLGGTIGWQLASEPTSGDDTDAGGPTLFSAVVPAADEASSVATPGDATAVRAPALAAVEPPEAPPPPARTLLSARVVDALGAPIAGAVLRIADESARAESDPDGRVRLAVPEAALRFWDGRQLVSRFVLERGGYATRFLEATPIKDEETRIGDLVLQPGGRVTGLVVTSSGLPVADARVVATDVALGEAPGVLRVNGPNVGPGAPTTRSGADGRFELAGVPVGDARVWAGSEGTGWAWSEPLVVLARGVTSDVRVVLDPLGPEDRIGGVVVGPDGAPVPRAEVRYSFPSALSMHRAVVADAEGRFEILAEAREPHDLRVEDPDQRLRPAIERGVEPGTEELVVRLTESRAMRVAVRDLATGELLPRARVDTRGELSLTADWNSRIGNKGLEEGEHWIRVPQDPFSIRARAEGWAETEVGPFEPDAAPEAVTIRMRALGAVRGRVTHAGEPVAGARVELGEQVGAGTRITSLGFRMRMEPFRSGGVETDAEGRFALTPERAGKFSLLVRADGFATAERGPLELDPQRALNGVDVELVRGGAIAGHVLPPEGREREGQLVSISRGDGDVRFARTDADGAYRFDGLAPGGWQVAHRTREAPISATYEGVAGPLEELEWSCEVLDGGTTRYDIDLRFASLAVLRGQLMVDGSGAEDWTATLEPDTASDLVEPVRAVLLDAEGRFELRAVAGAYRLVLQNGADQTGVQVMADVRLGEEPTAWSFAYATGTLRGTSAVAATSLRFGWRSAEDVYCGITFEATEDGSFHVPGAPAGAGWIQRLQPSERDPSRLGWHRLEEVAVEAGRVTELDLR